MIHIKELVARRASVHGGQRNNGFRGVVIQHRDGIGGLSMTGEKTQHTDEQQFHPGISGADASSMTMTSADSVVFARGDDNQE